MKLLAIAAILLNSVAARDEGPTELYLRGYSVIPAPRKVQLADGKIIIDHDWKVGVGSLLPRDIAVRSLVTGFQEFHGISLKLGDGSRAIRLAIQPGTVTTSTPPEIDRQAYRLSLKPDLIEITGNGEPGLFYGVQTLIQLARRNSDGKLTVPRGVIEDWPALQLRFLHWDQQQHQDRVETLKRYLDWAALLKVNMIAFQLEDKFEFPSHPVVGMPGAYTTAQLQELVDYGMERYIQVVPLIQAPAHFSWALKHPEFAELRSDGNNYQANTCDPRAMRFIFDLYDDVIRASKGVDYLFVSTDEVYYAGIDPRCGRPYNPENRSLNWVDFVKHAHEYVTGKHGRRMLIWGEYPLLAEHVKLLPADIIDGVSMEPEYLPEEKKLGMRQLFYVWTEGEEWHFPNYLGGPGGDGWQAGHLERVCGEIAKSRLWQGNPIGVFGAAWVPSGPHNETFWLGWSAVANWGWNPGAASPDQHMAEFLRLYYGPRADGMGEVYALMQQQARAWEKSWDRVPSRVRGLSYGNSRGKGIGTERWDLTLTAPPLPALPDLRVEPVVRAKYRSLLEQAERRGAENERLVLALQSGLGRVERNRYNLEVYLAVAKFLGHQWRLLEGMAEAEKSLGQAQEAAAKKEPPQAVGLMVAAHNAIDRLVKERVALLKYVTAVFEKSRYPRGQAVGGRKFVDINDDTKDYRAQRRPDMSYLTAPEESIGLEQWRDTLRGVIESYAKQHNVPVKELPLLEE